MSASEFAIKQQIEHLYVDHHGWLNYWLRRKLGDKRDAADLAQDAFVRLLARPRDFASAAQARQYLRVMANGLCVDLWRRREIEHAWLDALAAQPDGAHAGSAEDKASVLQALQTVDAMLRNLPGKTAEAFVLAVGCGMTDVEVAARLGVSDRMVRKYVARAMLHCLCLQAAGPLD